MIYNNFQDIKISSLAMGCMRLPIIDNDESLINETATAEMVAYAMEHGINYYDTAWGYHEGNSERVMGKLLREYPRENYYIASKFPGYDLKNMPKVEKIFEKQLQKTGMEYFDFYLFHNLCEMNIDAYLDDEKYGIFSYLMKQKQNGRIRHLGFSIHGSNEVLQSFMDAYGEHMEFCQIQLNWLDWSFQDAKTKVEMLNKYNIPIWVMEPLRGGRLASLSEQDTNLLKSLRPQESVVGWAYRFLQSVKGVTVTLSGASSLEQMKENIRIFETSEPLNQEEKQTLFTIADNMLDSVPCTACRYCTSYCPNGLDIPRLIELYNEHNFTGGGFLAPMALQAIDKDKQPANCISCHSCEEVCPQNIQIAEVLADFTEKLKD